MKNDSFIFYICNTLLTKYIFTFIPILLVYEGHTAEVDRNINQR